MKKNETIVITLLLCLFLAGTIISSVSAKNFNIPDGAYIIYYSGGEAYVTIPMSTLNPGTPHLSDGVQKYQLPLFRLQQLLT